MTADYLLGIVSHPEEAAAAALAKVLSALVTLIDKTSDAAARTLVVHMRFSGLVSQLRCVVHLLLLLLADYEFRDHT